MSMSVCFGFRALNFVDQEWNGFSRMYVCVSVFACTEVLCKGFLDKKSIATVFARVRTRVCVCVCVCVLFCF